MLKGGQDKKTKGKVQEPLEITMINGFEVGRQVGKGKFGNVFLGKHADTGFIVALKKVQKAKLKEYNMVDQFIKEIKLHNSFDHPKIVRFHGVFEQPDSFNLILEYMNGGTLFQYLNKVKTLTMR